MRCRRGSATRLRRLSGGGSTDERDDPLRRHRRVRDLDPERLEGVLDRNPDDGATLLNLTRLNVALHRMTEARRLLVSWLARHPDDPVATKLARQLDGQR